MYKIYIYICACVGLGLDMRKDVGANPSNLRRRCTDVSWLVAYAAYSGLVIYMGIVVWPKGQPLALLTLTDWRGLKCGLGSNENRSLLFFCPGASRVLLGH